MASYRRGSDIRLFNGRVPPWPEAEEAVEDGEFLAGAVGVPFYFPRPDDPTAQVLRWWDARKEPIED